MNLNFAAFEALLHDTMGLSAATLGPSAIERVISERMRICGEADGDGYLLRVQSSPTERQELIEALIVPETWFFRDPEAFAALTRLASERWLTAPRDGTMEVLSVPCCTGEEPYSMAMALFEAGLPAERFNIDALDISAWSLTKARRGIYGRNSFRGEDLTFRDRYFEAAGGEYRLVDQPRQTVSFRQGNLLDPALALGVERYEVIFCRNLLIYFDRPTQDRAIQILRKMLKPDGWLFVGSAETSLLLSQGFVSSKIPHAFAFRKAEPVEPKPRPPRVASLLPPLMARPLSSVFSRRTLSPLSSAIAPLPVPPANAKKTPAPALTLETALRLADEGRLAEATNHCDEFMRQHGPSAHAYYVSGLVRDAIGRSAEARELYRKAVYLDPHHYEALIHLASSIEQQGNTAGAEVLRARVRRLESPKA